MKFRKTLPSAVFEKSIQGARVYTTKQRAIAFLYKGFEYAAVGFACGLVGQSAANTAMIAKRRYFKKSSKGQINGAGASAGSSDSESTSTAMNMDMGDVGVDVDMGEIPVPPLFRTACVWALFMGVSSNTRYQIVFGLERLVEGTALAKSVPAIGK